MVHVNNKTNVGELLSSYPEVSKTLRKFGVPASGG